MKLSDEQAAAAFALGSVAITAGAGAGKTGTLAERYIFHVRSGIVKSPLEIAAVTFTDKAADELRARIRREFRGYEGQQNIDGEVIAEVDAAQISTIHALAARICRDFYYLAGIPADFRVLDEAEAEVWRADQITQAISDLPLETFETLEYRILADAVYQLVENPHLSKKALEVSISDWRSMLEGFREKSTNEFLNGRALSEGWEVLQRYHGEEDDKREILRVEILAVLSRLRSGGDLVESLNALSAVELGGGTARKWPGGGFKEVKVAIEDLRTAARALLKRLVLESNEHDEELARRVQVLKQAYGQISEAIVRNKKEEGILDFNDLEIYALDILGHEEVRRHYRARWKAVMVDEFQDTNPAQGELIKLLTEGDSTTLTIVGDRKQAIYGFRGADVEIFDRFVHEIESSESGTHKQLRTSYRTHEALVELTNAIFEPVLGELHEGLSAVRPTSPISGPFVELHSIEAGDKEFPADERLNAEAEFIAQKIKVMVESGEQISIKGAEGSRPLRYEDIAVLSRTWAPLETIADALSAKGIPVAFSGDKTLLQTRESLDVIALIAFLADPTDDVALITVLRSPFFGVSDKVLYGLSHKVGGGSRWWDVVREESGVLGEVYKVLLGLIDMRPYSTAAELVNKADEQTGYSAIFANLPHAARRGADWRGILNLLADLERQGKDDVFSVARTMKALIEFDVKLPRLPVDAGDAVQMTTIHGAKGLEWPVVFVPSLTRQSRGDYKSIRIDAELGVAFAMDDEDGEKIKPAILQMIELVQKEREEKERKRVLYVALTRAREKVILSSASKGKAHDLKLLLPGIEAAGIDRIMIPVDKDHLNPPQPGEPAEFPGPVHVQIESLPPMIGSVRVTGLSDYLRCPKLFKYRYVDGHPGLGEGGTGAARLGTLTHLALEKNVADAEELRRLEGGATIEDAETAIDFAKRFRTHKAFAQVRDRIIDKELDLSLEVGGLMLTGVADAVGDDFVLDYKTDKTMEPEHHKLQLWAYTRALGKSAGHLAYLRHDEMHTFTAEDLHGLDEVAEKTAKAITEGRFAAKPEEGACRFCSYREICGDKVGDK